MATMKRRKHARMHTGMLAVDYPRQNEKITSSNYTIRVFAPEGARSVDISIDQGPLQSCRNAVGFWWYDWSGYENGEHQIAVSMETPEGVRVISEPHEFYVELSDSLVAR
jgi:hypothetical protein